MKMWKLLGACVALTASAAYAEQLTVDQVTALATSGIGDEAIIAKIRSSGSHFDLSTDDMIALKNKGVSGAVLAAMLGSGEKTNAMSTTSPDPATPHPSGVYLLAGDQMARIDPTSSNQAKTGGIFGYALTGGLASISVKASIQNGTARVRANTHRPVFYFFFDESNGTPSGSTWAAGTAATVTSPSEFTLVHLIEKDGRRETRVGSMNIGGAKTGVMDKDRIGFHYDLIRPGVFKVSPDGDLPAGEYGFIFSLTGGNGAGALTARIYDFGVNKDAAVASK